MHIGIVGCGYLGLELCRQLIEADHMVTGIRRSDSGLAAIEQAGGRALQADVTDEASLEQLPPVDVVVFAASSGGRGAANAREVYVTGFRKLVRALGKIDPTPDRLLYTSSTGVYGDHDGDWVDESTPVATDTERREVLVAAEEIALAETDDFDIDGTVARLAGIYGPERYRIDRYLTGPIRPGIRNFIHRVDGAGALKFLIEEGVCRDERILVVDNEPVDRRTVSRWLAQNLGIDPPAMGEQTKPQDRSQGRGSGYGKRCCNRRLRSLGYEFQYPTFRDGYRPAIEDRP